MDLDKAEKATREGFEIQSVLPPEASKLDFES
jgi:hypothetical protein